MLKENKKILIITSIVILLPVLAGLLLWDQLPDLVATHWNSNGNPDGWGSKSFAVFAPPLFMLAAHWLCVLVTFSDPKNKKRNKKARTMVLWTMPFVSLFSSTMRYGTALEVQLNFASITFAMVGIIFVIIGNYLPKTSQNYTIGIKVPWALHSEENWNATHRFGGKLWVIGGLALLLFSFLATGATMVLMVVILLVMGLVPILYSWLYYKRQIKAGTADASIPKTKEEKLNTAILKGTMIFLAVLCVLVAFLLFTGELEYIYEADSFTVDPSNWNSLTVEYSEITDVELRMENVPGTREWGLGNFRVLLGSFENEEFGRYTRYTYYDPEACVVVTCGEKTLVLSGSDAESTQAIYDELTARLEAE